MAERFFAVARTEDLIVQEMGPETLVFDRRTDVAHNLSPIASVVWNLCDGKHDVDALVAAVAEIEPAEAQVATEAALAELGDLGLLTDGVSRRETMKRMAKFGAGALATPLVVSVIAPTAAMATTPGGVGAGGNCTRDTDCQTNALVCRTSTGNPTNGGTSGKCVNSNCSVAGSAVLTCGNPGDNKGSYTTALCCTGSCTKASNGQSVQGTCN